MAIVDVNTAELMPIRITSISLRRRDENTEE